MKRIAFIFCLFLSASFADAQNLTDADRRGFSDLKPITVDVDGDNKPDIITPRTYQVKPKGTRKPQVSEIQNWISFDLATSKGRMIKDFFKYNYGTAEQGGSYWVYALKSAGDVDGDGSTDLFFYSGDDTSDESIVLANKGNKFSVHSKKQTDNSSW